MNSDLEAQLESLGPDYRAVVDRLLDAYRPAEFRREPVVPTCRFGRMASWSAGYLIAASVLVCIGLGVVFMSFRAPKRAGAAEYLLAHLHDDASVQEMLRTQNADGSWQNDFLTRQNAFALRNRSDEPSRIAYKRAMRNLRCRGLL